MSRELNLPAAARALGTAEFAEVLKAELEALPADALPLEAALTHTSHVADRPHQVVVLAHRPGDDGVFLRVGVFYQGIIAGCSCADDPTPVEPQTEYCELHLWLDPASGRALVLEAPQP
jgi:hypothetical protein